MFVGPSLRALTTNGLVGWYPCNQAARSGGPVLDMSGNGNSATANAALKFEASIHGGQTYPSGGGYTLPLALSMHTFTWSVWYYPVSISGSFAIMGSIGGTAYVFWYQNSTALRGYVAGVSIYASGTGALVLGAWQHLVFRYNDVTGAFGAYINGNRHAVGTAVHALTPAVVTVGTANNGNGISPVADVRIYNRELTDAEIRSLYQGGAVSPVDAPFPILPVPPPVAPTGARVMAMVLA